MQEECFHARDCGALGQAVAADCGDRSGSMNGALGRHTLCVDPGRQ